MEKIALLFIDVDVHRVRKLPLPQNHSQTSAKLSKILNICGIYLGIGNSNTQARMQTVIKISKGK